MAPAKNKYIQSVHDHLVELNRRKAQSANSLSQFDDSVEAQMYHQQLNKISEQLHLAQSQLDRLKKSNGKWQRYQVSLDSVLADASQDLNRIWVTVIR